MTPEEKETYRKVFQILDEDGGNTLDFEEISLAMKMVGMNNSMDQLRKDVLLFGNQDGELDLNGFLQLVEASKNSQTTNQSRQPKRPGEKKKPDSPSTRPRSALRESASPAANYLDAQTENEDKEKEMKNLEHIVLPFHLFLPAFSRKKNLEFVMDLELVEGASLPHPLDEAAAASRQPETATPREKAYRRLQQCLRCPDCSSRPVNLLSIHQALRNTPNAIQRAVALEEDSKKHSLS